MQVSLINSLVYPLVLIPMHFIVGLLVFHRTQVELGIAWFVLSAGVLPLFGFDQFTWWSYILTAVLGFFLIRQLFTTRSLYALEGFGITMFVAFVVLNVLPDWITKIFIHSTNLNFFLNFRGFLLTLVFLIVGLYAGFIFSKFMERIANEILLIK